MWTDQIVEETRAIRDAQAKRFDYDLEAIVTHLKARQREEGRHVVSFPPKPALPTPQEAA